MLSGVAAFTFSVLTAAPALADESPEVLREVSVPAGTEIVEGALVSSGTGPAQAGLSKAAPTGECLGPIAAYGVQGCFQHYGDITWVGDTKSDGMSAAVGVFTRYGRASFVCLDTQGVNTWATCKKNYWEDGDVRLQALRYDRNTGKFYEPENWSGWIPVDGQY